MELTGNTNAQDWAREFVGFLRYQEGEGCRLPVDEDLMLGWFANAIEAGRDAGLRGRDEARAALGRALAGAMLESGDGGVLGYVLDVLRDAAREEDGGSTGPDPRPPEPTARAEAAYGLLCEAGVWNRPNVGLLEPREA